MHDVAQTARRTYVKCRTAIAEFLEQMPIVYNAFLSQPNITQHALAAGQTPRPLVEQRGAASVPAARTL